VWSGVERPGGRVKDGKEMLDLEMNENVAKDASDTERREGDGPKSQDWW
jgi:hypothetical protein